MADIETVTPPLEAPAPSKTSGRSTKGAKKGKDTSRASLPFTSAFKEAGFSFSKSVLATDVVLMASKSENPSDERPIEYAIEEGRTGRAHQAHDGDSEDARNLYRSERAYLPFGYDTLVARFEVVFTNNLRRPHSVSLDLLPWFGELTEQLIRGGEVEESIRRAIKQIAGGQFLWRNLDYSRGLVVTIEADGKPFDFVNAEGYLPFSAGATDPDVDARIEELKSMVMGVFVGVEGSKPRRNLPLTVTARMRLGAMRHEVFPSQLMKLSDSAASKDNYREYFKASLGGGERTTAIRAVKAMNRVRTYDDWSVMSTQYGIAAPISPKATVLQYGAEFRPDHESFYALIVKAHSAGYKGLEPSERCYVAAQLLFGGLFTEAKAKDVAEEKPKDSSDGDKASAESAADSASGA